MKNIITFLLLIAATVAQAQQKPKLVVGIIVDQMRQEYLYRFESKYGEGGFKRMINEGFMMKNAHYNYTPTYTAPGHTSVYTGATPATHGIIGNNWFDKSKGTMIYCAYDESKNTVGTSTNKGKMSPQNLLTTTITDELKFSTQQRSKVVGISIKDRGAIFPAGHMGDAYWYDGENGNFITSTYYHDKLPKWVKYFNKRKLAASYLRKTWEPLYPINTYIESGSDENTYEGKMPDKSSVFPYDLSAGDASYDILPTTPFGNEILTHLAFAAFEGEKLGSDDITDFLCVSYSATDYIGHKFGPNSVEVEDTYLRLDKNIAQLLDKLDKELGKGNYLVFLTADHAVAEVPGFLIDNNVPAGEFNYLTDSLKLIVAEKYGDGEFIANISNDQVFLSHEVIRKKGLVLKEVQDFITDQLLRFNGVAESHPAYVIKNSDFNSGGLKGFLTRGYHQKRSGDVLFSLEPGWFSHGRGTGTTHGSAYTYDTHVPLLWFGAGISQGESVQYHPITDIAPTLSMMLNIKLPSGSTGQPIEELFEK